MTEPLCIKIDGTWTPLPLRSTEEMVVNAEGISISYEALEGSVADQEQLGAFRPDPPPKAPKGKEITARTLRPDGDRPAYDVTYGDAPEPGVPEEISPRQFFQQLARDGDCSEDDALAYVQVGKLPQVLLDAIATLPASAQFDVKMELIGANSYYRSSPNVDVVGWLMNKDKAALNQIWRLASKL